MLQPPPNLLLAPDRAGGKCASVRGRRADPAGEMGGRRGRRGLTRANGWGDGMAEPFPAEPIRAACPSCGTPVLFPRLHGLAPGSTVSCDCPRCGRKVSVVNTGASHPSKARRAAVLLVALAVIVAVIMALVL
jgi:endogenous inhibitor of DNA gyrase (YacG/DUF329 family)